MVKYALFVKESNGKWSRLTKKGREYTSKKSAIARKIRLKTYGDSDGYITRKKIGVRRV